MLKIKKLLLSVALIAPFAMEATPVSPKTETAKAASSSSSSCSKDCSSISKNLWQPHAFSNYASQEILIMKGLDLDATENSWLNRVGFASEYMQSFDNKNCHGLGAMPFWSGTNTMTIGQGDGKADLDAYQFGMGDVKVDENGIAGTITLAPKVQHVGAELLWFNMQNKKHGAYFKVKAPLGAMIIDSNLCETPIELKDTPLVNNGTTSRNAYFLPTLRFQSLSDALHGGTNQYDPLYSYGKIADCKQTVIRLGDITVALGVNLLAKEDKQFAIGAKFSCPTGNVPQAIYMLEPIFGRAGHWGVGGEMFGQYTYNFDSNDCDKERSVRLWYQGEIMHLFSGRKPNWRSFDLAGNGNGSKYLLLQHYINDVKDETGTKFVADSLVIPAINVTTLPVKTSFDIEGNFALSVDFRRDNWNLAVMGEFWGRTKESLSIDCCVNDDRNNFSVDYNLNNYAVLGRQTMQIAASTTTTTTWAQPNATINTAAPAWLETTTPTNTDIVNGALAANRISANYNTALNVCGAAAKSIYTGKVLGELGYTWRDNCHVPNLSIFGGAELARSNNSWPKLWSVGLQGSLQF